MTNRILKNSRFLFIASAALMLNPSAFANNSAPKIVSSLCQPEVVQDLKCKDDRACAFKTQSVIEDFFEKYETPTPKEIIQIQYPHHCRRGYIKNAVNLTYNIGPDGKPQKVRVLNTSNKCFSNSARRQFKQLKYDATAQGYSCVPATVSFVLQRRIDDTSPRWWRFESFY